MKRIMTNVISVMIYSGIFIFALLVYAAPAWALDCVNDYGGTCMNLDSSQCGDSGGVAVKNWLTLSGSEIGCPDSQLCCVKKCSSLGGFCTSDTASCSENKKQLDCGKGKICCTQTSCQASGFVCEEMSTCLANGTEETALTPSYAAFTDSGDLLFNKSSLSNPICCNKHPETRGYCDDVDPSNFYCADQCPHGNDSSSTVYQCKNSNQQCCSKAMEQALDKENPSNTDIGNTGPQQGYDFNLSPGSCTSFTCIIRSILTGVQKSVGWLAVIFIVIGGLMYIVSGGSALTNTAKATITWALVGFAIAVAAPTLMKEIYDLVTAGGGTGAGAIDDAKSIKQIVGDVLSFLLGVVGVLAIIGFVVSGVLFVTSAGNTSQADTARKAMLYTIIGIVVSGAGLIIVRQILQLANGQY